MNVPMVRPDLTSLETDYAHKALIEGEIGVKSPYVKEFEEKLAVYTGFKFAVFCNSGWSALVLACRVAKEELGYTEITMPTFTMIATGTAAKQTGFKINFEDVDERGLLRGKYEGLLMTVDMYGKLCEARADFIIEDAAEVAGKLPYYGNIVCMSFFYNKIMTTGNGGACLTNDENLYKEMCLFRHHYYDGHSYVHNKDGYNFSQTGVMAAIGTKQLERLEEILAKRKALGERYVNELGAWSCDTYWYQPYLCGTPEVKQALGKFLEQKGIATRDFFNPLHKMPPFGKKTKLPMADKLYGRGILLPLFSAMTKEEQDYVIDSVHQFYNNIPRL